MIITCLGRNAATVRLDSAQSINANSSANGCRMLSCSSSQRRNTSSVHIVHWSKSKRISEQDRRLLKRRQAIEPIIGHLKGETSDRLHSVLCAAGYNIRWLLRMIAKKGMLFLQPIFCACTWWRAFRRTGSWPAPSQLPGCVHHDTRTCGHSGRVEHQQAHPARPIKPLVVKDLPHTSI